MAKNSQNSSLPPSGDNQAQREARRKPAKREKGKRSRGKQPGAPGAHLERVAEPDRVVDHAPFACRGCGGDLSGAEITGIESRQVFDPDRRAEVTDLEPRGGAAPAGARPPPPSRPRRTTSASRTSSTRPNAPSWDRDSGAGRLLFGTFTQSVPGCPGSPIMYRP
ncbi:MAG: DUF6444 domain-containing protein [Anaerolineales bacterium]